jgi:hypothetical protein
MIGFVNEEYGKKYEMMSEENLKKLIREYEESIKELITLIMMEDTGLEEKLAAVRDAIEIRIEQGWVRIAEIKKKGNDELLKNFLRVFYVHIVALLLHMQRIDKILGNKKWRPKTPVPVLLITD